jgi:ribonuclease PH
LIGRALRSVVDLPGLGERMVRVDCDVIQADGGTRTAAVTGAWVALHQTLADAVTRELLTAVPLVDQVAAISVGLIDGAPLLDLEYEDDVRADVDLNVVMSGRGLLVEVQGTAEKGLFDRADLDGLLDLAGAGIARLVELQRQAIA